MSRAQRYALGAAIALSLVATACKNKEEEPSVEAESAENAASAAPLAAPEPPRRPPTTDDRSREAPPPPSPFLVGAPPADPPRLPDLPQRVENGPVDSGVPDAGRVVQKRPPPPPPPPDPDGWRRNRGNGPPPNPPYGCVFPDEACDILRV